VDVDGVHGSVDETVLTSFVQIGERGIGGFLDFGAY
jgi:hypothetical protein